uniref:Ubiquitin-like domain-containing protein n=1 Tax=Periophthalmus magnuspinnatus TaxID=409849 RepID=A0A3B3Z8I8_9GOBI
MSACRWLTDKIPFTCLKLGKSAIVDVCQTEEQFRSLTVRDLKTKIRQQLDWTSDYDFRLIFQCETLEDDHLLSHYGIRHLSTIQAVLILLGGER